MKNTHSKLKEEKDNKKKKKETGFTLVELIVVITILAILSTIAFISFTGYSQNSRDSKRIADINSIQKSLELYITEKGTYPIPDNNSSITYSGGTAWIEGTVGDAVIRNLDKINKKPLDPLTENEYTYSVTSSKTEYQIGAITEGGTIGYKLPINQTHAVTDKKATAMIRGTYNERFLRVQSGALNWILAIPSIIATDLTQTNVQTILDNNKLVYNNYQNIPHSYNNAGYTMTGGFNYTNTNPLIYSGSLKYLTESNTGKLDFITNLKVAYYGTILHGEANYQDIVNADLSNQTGSIYLVNRFINTNLGGIKVSNIILPTTGGIIEQEVEQEATYTISNCPTVNVARNGTTPTKTTILANINNYIGCEVSGKTGKVAGYSYSGSVSEENKMILLSPTIDESVMYPWGTNYYDVTTLPNTSALTNTGLIEMWDGYNNSLKILAKVIELGETNKAVQICNSKGEGWYLPSIEEMTQLYCYSIYASNTYADCANKGYANVNIGTILNFSTAEYYHASNEGGTTVSWYIRFSDGYRLSNAKTNNSFFRCVNRF